MPSAIDRPKTFTGHLPAFDQSAASSPADKRSGRLATILLLLTVAAIVPFIGDFASIENACPTVLRMMYENLLIANRVFVRELFMNFVPVLLILAVISNTSEPTDYKTAYKRAQKGDKPLLVLVTAEWCPPCRMMKQSTIPEMVENNQFRDFHFATVDLDRNNKDARNLIGTAGVPQLIIYENNNGTWRTRMLSGFNDVAAVKSFLGASEQVRTANAGSRLVDQ